MSKDLQLQENIVHQSQYKFATKGHLKIPTDEQKCFAIRWLVYYHYHKYYQSENENNNLHLNVYHN